MKNNNFEISQFNEENKFLEFKEYKAEEYHSNEFKQILENEYTKEIYDKSFDSKEKNNFNNFLKNITSNSSLFITSSIVIVAASSIGIIPLIHNSPLIINKEESIPNQILIEGTINNYKEDTDYIAYVHQYYDKQTYEEDYIHFDIEKNNFHFEIDVYFGIKSYQYQIGYYTLNEEFISIVSSSKKDFLPDQSYQATYNKISPKEATITYIDENTYNIHINTHFETKYKDAYQYKLKVTDKDNNIYNEYLGTDQEIDLLIENADEIYFEYQDIGLFNYEQHVYESYKIDSSIIKSPNVHFNDEVSFDGQNFIVSYFIDTIYDLNEAYLDLNLKTSTKTYQLKIDNLEQKGQIILDMLLGDIGEVIIDGTLHFVDNQINKQNTIKIKPIKYHMNYIFTITNIRAEMFDRSKDTIPIIFNFDYLLPNDYSLQIICEETNYNQIIPLDTEFILNNITFNNGGTIKINILNSEKNIYKMLDDIQILSYNDANELFIEPTINYVNPSESIVTYNDDSTINIYRKTNFTSTNENIYYDAFIYNKIIEIDRITYLDYYHNISNEKYSIIENIPQKNYYFIYYTLLKFNNVYYYMNQEMPSGGIEINDSDVNISGNYNNEKNITTLNITFQNNVFLKKECIIDNNYYQYDNYEEKTSSTTLTILGNMLNKEIKLYFNKYYNNYAEYLDIPILGNIYKEYIKIVN